MATRVEELIGPHVWRGRSGCSAHPVLATGFEGLDEKLGGGWPWGAMIEIIVRRYGSGELSLLMPALASLSDRNDDGWIVWVSPPFIPYAPALVGHGIDVERVLVAHPGSRPGQAGDEALWATEQALRSGASAAVLAWLSSASDTVLRRLQLAAEEQRCGLVLFRPERALQQRSPAALRMSVSPDEAGVRVDVLKRRGGRPESLRVGLAGTRRFASERACR